MARVGPTFDEPLIGTNTVSNMWGVNGDTPVGFRIYQDPFDTSRYIDVGLGVNAYEWTNLRSETLMRLCVACIYQGPYDLKSACFEVRTLDTPSPPPPRPIDNFRAAAKDDGAVVWVELTWSPDSRRMVLTRKGPEGELTLFDGTPGGSSSSWGDRPVLHGANYTYTLTAYEPDGRTSGATAQVTTPAPAPAPAPAPVRWHDWNTLAVIDTAHIAAVASDHRRADVFFPGADSRIDHMYTNGNGWVRGDLGPGSYRGPMAAASFQTRIDVISASQAPGASHSELWHTHWDGQAWSPAENLGGTVNSAPALASLWGWHHLEVFYRGANDHLIRRQWNLQPGRDWRDRYTAGWTGEEDLGGTPLMGRPAAVAPSWPVSRVDVFYTGPTRNLLHRWSERLGPWSDEEDLGGDVVGDPAAVSWGANHIDVYYRHISGVMLHRWWTGSGWSAAEGVGPPPSGSTWSPAVAAWGPNRIDLFVPQQVDRDIVLKHRFYGG